MNSSKTGYYSQKPSHVQIVIPHGIAWENLQPFWSPLHSSKYPTGSHALWSPLLLFGIPFLSEPNNFNFYSTDFAKNQNAVLEGSEKLISAILASPIKIRVPPASHLWSRFHENINWWCSPSASWWFGWKITAKISAEWAKSIPTH